MPQKRNSEILLLCWSRDQMISYQMKLAFFSRDMRGAARLVKAREDI